MRVLHLVGSATDPELAELSRLYARGCLEATADPSRWEPVVAYVWPDGSWRFPSSLDDDDVDTAPGMPIEAAVARLRELAPDVAVPHMFCLPGMTTFRALFELLGVPYVGNRPDVMATAAHKDRARAIVAAFGVRVPEAQLVRRGEAVTLAPPVVVKPADADNSLGVSLVLDVDSITAALEDAFGHSQTVLVEEFVPLGREVRCGIVERAGELVVLPLEEYAVDPVHKPVRDAADKLARNGDGDLRLVAKSADYAWIVDADDPIVPAVAEAARACHRALACRHYSLFDFRIDPHGEPWFLEAGLYCSFSRSSVVAVMAAAAGIPVDELFADAIELALAGSADRV